MKYILVLAAYILCFAQCKRGEVNVQPTGSYDTLGIHWMTIERNNIFYYFQGSGVNAASIFTDMHEEAYNKLSPVFNAKLPQKLRFFVWTDMEAAEQLLGRPLGFAVSSRCVCNIAANQTLGHEMTHVLSFWGDGIPPNTVTRFINEGVAVAFDLKGNDKIADAKSALSGYNVNTIAEFWSGSLISAQDEVFYPVAGAFMEFMYKKNMPDQYKALLKNQTYQNAEVIYGKAQLETLIKEFDALLGI